MSGDAAAQDGPAADAQPVRTIGDLQALLGEERSRRDPPFGLGIAPGGAGDWWECPEKDYRERAYPDGLRAGGRCPHHNLLLEPAAKDSQTETQTDAR